MLPGVKVFISYRNVSSSRMIARDLASRLAQDGLRVFWDVSSLRPGEEWARTIYENIHSSDVLLVLLEAETANSDWVQREVDVARGAHVSILPVNLVSNIDEADTLKKLALDAVQFLNYTDPAVGYGRILESIDYLAEKTRREQREQIKALQEKWKKNPVSPPNLDYAIYRLPSAKPATRIHLATGSIHEFEDVDVLVNSENDHLQMSRIHENYTVSSCLRSAGSWTKKGSKRIFEDTVQWELDTQADALEEGRPVELCTIFPTNAGHPESKLRQNRIRYIFHAVTVSVFADNYDTTMVPIGTNPGIKKCVANCLERVHQVNAGNGIISSPSLTMSGGRQPYLDEYAIADANAYKPIKSIAFPIFGSGHGGRKIQDVITPMLEAVKTFLTKNPKTSLKTIYICAYAQDDIPPIQAAMNLIFEPVRSRR